MSAVVRRWASWLVTAALFVAACTGGPGPSQAGPTQTATAAATATPNAAATSFTFDMCSILSESDVTSTANYPIPFWQSEGPTDTACEYDFNDHDHATATITVGADSYPTVDEIRSGIMQTVNDYDLDNWPTEQLSGAGDWAWWVCQVPDFGECTLYVQKATYEVSVQTTPSQDPPIDNDMRKAVAIALANIVLGRLP